MDRIRLFVRAFGVCAYTATYLATRLLFVGVVVWVFQPIVPVVSSVVTALFMTAVTVSGCCGEPRDRAMSITGLALYLASWPAVAHFGAWTALPLVAGGLSLWFWAGVHTVFASMRNSTIEQRKVVV